MQAHGDAPGASVIALDNKINGTEPQVAAALVAHAFARGRPLVEAMVGLRASPLRGWRLRILDGNHLAVTERRPGKGQTNHEDEGTLKGLGLAELLPSDLREAA